MKRIHDQFSPGLDLSSQPKSGAIYEGDGRATPPHTLKSVSDTVEGVFITPVCVSSTDTGVSHTDDSVSSTPRGVSNTDTGVSDTENRCDS